MVAMTPPMQSVAKVSPLSTHRYLHANLVNLIRRACRQTTAPKIPKKKAVGMSLNPAEGVIITKPAMAPIKVASNDQRPVSNKHMHAQVSAPEAAHKFVTQSAMTDWKLSVSAVPASKAIHGPQNMVRGISWQKELPGRWRRIWAGVLTADSLDLTIG